MKHRSPLLADHSAAIHLAACSPKHTNSFRMSLFLKEPICPQSLQRAVERVYPRFPGIFCGIRGGAFQYHLTPADGAPRVQADTALLAPMSEDELRRCACRVLYRGNVLTLEVFHALTDGHGGLTVLGTLTAEYLRLSKGLDIPFAPFVLDPDEEPDEAELADDFAACAGPRAGLSGTGRSYQLPQTLRAEEGVQCVWLHEDTARLQQAARHYGVRITSFLCAVMAEAIREFQCAESDAGRQKLPIRIMVPINLRGWFASRTLRNFALFALCSTAPDEDLRFEALLERLDTQLQQQNNAEALAAVLRAQTSAAQFPLFRALPLSLKTKLLRQLQKHFGDAASCITLSNLGPVRFPDALAQQVEHIDLALTPRWLSGHNCVMLSFGQTFSIGISSYDPEGRLAAAFARRLHQKLDAPN